MREAPPFTSPREKETFVRGMFDRVAPRYDLLNRLMAAGLDERWRRRAARRAVASGAGPFLDVGAGTGDLTLALARAAPGARVLGLDLAAAMLRVARRKEPTRVGWLLGSGLALPAREGTFEGITNAFVLRNLADMDVFFRDAHRALRPGGRLVSLEIGKPPGRLFGPLYALYFFRLVPRVGRWVSGDRTAYDWLARSVERIEPPAAIAERMRRASFRDVTVEPLMRGAVNLFVATKG